MQGQIDGTSRLQIQLEIESIEADVGSEGLATSGKVDCLDRLCLTKEIAAFKEQPRSAR